MIKKGNIGLLNKNAWEKVVDPFSDYRAEIEVTSFFKKFSILLCKKSEVLDLGCGTGIPFGKYISDSGHKLTGIDFSKGMIQKAKRNVPKGNFKIQAIDKIDNKNFYDGIVASYSLQLLDPNSFKHVISMCNTALKNDGFMYISLNEPTERKSDYVVFMGEKMFFKDYSENDLVNIFNKYGMKKIDIFRSVDYSETFGKECMIEMIFQKKTGPKLDR